MLKLSADRSPIRIELQAPAEDHGGAYLVLKPWGPAGIALAQAAGREAYLAADALTERQRNAEAYAAFAIALAAWGAISWEGVADADGVAVEVSPDRLRQLLEERFDVYQKVDEGYATPAMTWSAEKNASAPSPRGATPDSPGGRKTTKRARPGAARTTAKAAAKPAKTVRRS